MCVCIYIYILFVCLCARVEDWSREKLTKLNTIKEVFVNGIICTTMARRKKKKKKKNLHNNDQLADYKNKNLIGGGHFCDDTS